MYCVSDDSNFSLTYRGINILIVLKLFVVPVNETTFRFSKVIAFTYIDTY